MIKITYSTIDDDIQPRLPFTLNTNSLPTLINAGKILDNVNRFIIGWIKKSPSEPNDKLRFVETEITVEQIRAIHSGKIPSFELTKELKSLMDDFREAGHVKAHDFVFGLES